ncbi:MAG: tetratricopeptide repeat protein [Gammaproteobacteria bacterium]|nr:tetratricopeptide repeat protein [Gammaproteobacteria bacterium]
MNESILYQRLEHIHNEAIFSSVEQSMEKYLELLNQYPNETVIYQHLGVFFAKHHLFDQALLAIESGIELDDANSKNYFLKGRIYDESLNYSESIKSYEKCLELDSSNQQAKFNLSLALLSIDDFEKGLPLYQYRLSEEQFSRFSGIPGWDKPDRMGRIIIWSEQGVGDEIMFLRLAPVLSKLEGNFFIECDKRFVSTLELNFPEFIFLPKGSDISNSDFDYQSPMGDLLVHFYPELIEERIQQHFIKPVIMNDLESVFSGVPDKRKKVGISWLSMNEEYGTRRSVHIAQLLQHLDPAECVLVNLQYLVPEEDIKKIEEAGFELFDPVDCFNDLEGVFNLISKCDHVITIDNSVVHFAGALGVDVKLLLPRLPNWRWGLKGTKCDWYPTVDIFRQDTSMTWDSVIQQACSSIR